MKSKRIEQIKKEKHDLVNWKNNQNCANCGAIENLTIHHIIPKSKRGKNEKSNFVVLCWKCHTQVHKDSGNAAFIDSNWAEQLGWSRIRRWTEEDIELIITLKKQGYPYEQIAELLGRSLPSCYSMIHNVKLRVDKLSNRIRSKK